MERVGTTDRESNEVTDGVYLTQLAAGERMSLQYARVEPGAVVDEHSHENEQIGYVISGRITLITDDDEVELGPEDSYVVNADEPHAFANRGDETVVAVDLLSPPRGDPDWDE